MSGKSARWCFFTCASAASASTEPKPTTIDDAALQDEVSMKSSWTARRLDALRDEWNQVHDVIAGLDVELDRKAPMIDMEMITIPKSLEHTKGDEQSPMDFSQLDQSQRFVVVDDSVLHRVNELLVPLTSYQFSLRTGQAEVCTADNEIYLEYKQAAYGWLDAFGAALRRGDDWNEVRHNVPQDVVFLDIFASFLDHAHTCPQAVLFSFHVYWASSAAKLLAQAPWIRWRHIPIVYPWYMYYQVLRAWLVDIHVEEFGSASAYSAGWRNFKKGI